MTTATSSTTSPPSGSRRPRDAERPGPGGMWDDPWPPAAWPDVPTRVVLCRGDRFFPAPFVRRLARERLGVVADEIRGGHLPASRGRRSWPRGWSRSLSLSGRPYAVVPHRGHGGVGRAEGLSEGVGLLLEHPHAGRVAALGGGRPRRLGGDEGVAEVLALGVRRQQAQGRLAQAGVGGPRQPGRRLVAEVLEREVGHGRRPCPLRPAPPACRIAIARQVARPESGEHEPARLVGRQLAH